MAASKTKRRTKRTASEYAPSFHQFVLKHLQRSLKEIREQLGISQTELSERSGVSRGLIANVESGRHGLWIGHAIELYKALAVVERARQIEKPRNKATRMLLNALTYWDEVRRYRIDLLEDTLERTKKRLEAERHRLAGIQVEIEEARQSLEEADLIAAREAAKEDFTSYTKLVRGAGRRRELAIHAGR